MISLPSKAKGEEGKRGKKKRGKRKMKVELNFLPHSTGAAVLELVCPARMLPIKILHAMEHRHRPKRLFNLFGIVSLAVAPLFPIQVHLKESVEEEETREMRK
jgi:hypothetical protein